MLINESLSCEYLDSNIMTPNGSFCRALQSYDDDVANAVIRLCTFAKDCQRNT